MKIWLVLVVLFGIAGCGGSESSGETTNNESDATEPVIGEKEPETERPQSNRLLPTTPVDLDIRCDNAPAGSKVWTECETTNFARTLEAPVEQLLTPFLRRFVDQSLINLGEFAERSIADPSWLLSLSLNESLFPLSLTLNSPVTPLCATYGLPCTGDPFRYREAEGPDGRLFYETEADVDRKSVV